jgi:hypothetical protein
MACERTSRRVARKAARLLGYGRTASVRSVAASALRARRKSDRKRQAKRMTKRG